MTIKGLGCEEFQARRDTESLLSLLAETKGRDTESLGLSFTILMWENGVNRLDDLLLIFIGNLRGNEEEEIVYNVGRIWSVILCRLINYMSS